MSLKERLARLARRGENPSAVEVKMPEAMPADPSKVALLGAGAKATTAGVGAAYAATIAIRGKANGRPLSTAARVRYGVAAAGGTLVMIAALMEAGENLHKHQD